jgi:hypothetical protein
MGDVVAVRCGVSSGRGGTGGVKASTNDGVCMAVDGVDCMDASVA